VASRAILWSRVDLTMHRVLVNGAVGMISFRDGEPYSLGAMTIRDGRIVAFDILADPERLAEIELPRLGE
jgi:RNA polymerase sigma-70 factor (ECF subfamily)